MATSTQTVIVRPPVWALLVAVIIGGCFYIGGKAYEKNEADISVISVSGEGKVDAVPDIAQMSFGVRVERAKTSREAMERLSRQMTAVIDAVRNTGIEAKDIQTEQFSLNPAYDWTSGGQVLRGYDATQMLRVKVRDMEKTGTVLGAATSAGANQANDVQFTIDDPEQLRAQARAEAIANAKQKAKMLASQLGVRLVELKNYGEDSNGYAPPVMYGRGGAAADMATQESAPELPAGSQEVRVNVSLTYEIE